VLTRQENAIMRAKWNNAGNVSYNCTEITENGFLITSNLSQSKTHFLSLAPLNWQASRECNFLLWSSSSFASVSCWSIYLIETSIMANIRYFPSSGTTSDVGGMISTTSRKNTWRLMRIEMESVTWNCETFAKKVSSYKE